MSYDPLFDVARDAVDSVFGAGEYARMNADNPGVPRELRAKLKAEKMAERKWRLTCLICGYRDPYDGLVSMQEHAMHKHGYEQVDHRNASKRIVEDGYVWTFPDGVDWLEAKHRALDPGEAAQ